MFWKRQRDGRVKVFYYDPVTKQQKSLPRSETRHLDHEQDDVIDEWVKRKANLSRVVKVRPDLIEVGGAIALVDRFWFI